MIPPTDGTLPSHMVGYAYNGGSGTPRQHDTNPLTSASFVRPGEDQPPKSGIVQVTQPKQYNIPWKQITSVAWFPFSNKESDQ